VLLQFEIKDIYTYNLNKNLTNFIKKNCLRLTRVSTFFLLNSLTAREIHLKGE